MSFFSKIKKGLGIGTAKVELDVQTDIPKDAKEVKGKVTLIATSAQKVLSLKVNLVEKSTTGSGEERREVRRNIQTVSLGEGFELKENETREIPFTLPVDLGNKASFQLFGGTLEISASSAASQHFEIMAVADLEGVALDPSASQYVKFV